MTPSLTRRSLVQAGGGALALLVLGPVSAASASAAPLRRSTWQPLVGERLVLDGSAEVRLDAVADLVRAADDASLRGNDDNFELLLVGPPGFLSDVHRLRHPQLGEVELFLSPVGAPDGGVQRYEVVVDRLPVARPASAAPSGPAPAPAPAPAVASAAAAAAPARATRAKRRAKRVRRRRRLRLRLRPRRPKRIARGPR